MTRGAIQAPGGQARWQAFTQARPANRGFLLIASVLGNYRRGSLSVGFDADGRRTRCTCV